MKGAPYINALNAVTALIWGDSNNLVALLM